MTITETALAAWEAVKEVLVAARAGTTAEYEARKAAAAALIAVLDAEAAANAAKESATGESK